MSLEKEKSAKNIDVFVISSILGLVVIIYVTVISTSKVFGKYFYVSLN